MVAGAGAARLGRLVPRGPWSALAVVGPFALNFLKQKLSTEE